MSILNVAVLDHAILIGTDTAHIDRPTGVRTQRTKAMAFDRCVVAARGDLDLLTCFWGQLLGMPFQWDIERLRKALEPGIEAAARYLRQVRQGADPVDPSEIVIAGWADMYSGPRAWCATVELDGTVTVERIHDCMFAPGADQMPPIGTAADMLAATQGQLAAFRAKDPSEPIGGEFVVHELTGWGVTARRMGVIG